MQVRSNHPQKNEKTKNVYRGLWWVHLFQEQVLMPADWHQQWILPDLFLCPVQHVQLCLVRDDPLRDLGHIAPHIVPCHTTWCRSPWHIPSFLLHLFKWPSGLLRHVDLSQHSTSSWRRRFLMHPCLLVRYSITTWSVLPVPTFSCSTVPSA